MEALEGKSEGHWSQELWSGDHEVVVIVVPNLNHPSSSCWDESVSTQVTKVNINKYDYNTLELALLIKTFLAADLVLTTFNFIIRQKTN